MPEIPKLHADSRGLTLFLSAVALISFSGGRMHSYFTLSVIKFLQELTEVSYKIPNFIIETVFPGT